MKKFFVLAFAALLAVAFAVPAGAFEGKFEAVLMYDINVVDTDEDYQRNSQGNAGDGGWSSTQINLNPFGYVGFRLTDKNVGVRVNFAVRGWDDDAEGPVVHDPVLLRQHYGYWDVNDWFQLLVGQLASKHSRLGPSDVYSSRASASNDTAGIWTYALGYGNIFPRRIPQIQFNFKAHETTLIQLALANADPGNGAGGTALALPADPNGLLGAAANQSRSTTLPRIDFTVQFDWGPVGVYPSIMWAEQNIETDGFFAPVNAAGNAIGDPDVTAWNFALPVQFAMAGFTFKTELNWGQNWGNTNLYPHGDLGGAGGATLGHDWTKNVGGGTLPTSRAVLDANGNVADTDCLGWWAELSYKWGIITPGIAYGYQKVENDDMVTVANHFENDRSWFGIQVPIAAAPHWTITPYLKFYDHKSNDFTGTVNDLNLGEITLYGVHFMIAF